MTDPHPHDPAADQPPDQSPTPETGDAPSPWMQDESRGQTPVYDMDTSGIQGSDPGMHVGYKGGAGGPPAAGGLAGVGAVTPVWAGRAVVLVGVAAGATLLGEALGLGVVVVLFALGVIAARVRRPVALPMTDLRQAELPSHDRWVRVWWALAGGLALVPVLRAAPWVVVPALFASAAMASLAVTGGRRWGQLSAGLAALAARMPLGPFLATKVATRGVSLRPAGAAARGAALAAALLALFVPLLMSADAAFAQLLENVVPTGWDGGELFERALVLTLFVALGGALLHARLRPPHAPPMPASATLGAVESNIALGALVGLFAAFVALQAATLFGGDQHVLHTTGLTYAEYARSGFAQLLAVAALTFAVLGAARRWAQPHRVLLAALCLLTLVVLASALKRLGLYEETYGFTRLRLAAHGALLTRSPRALVATTAASVLLFALADPDRRIAEHNLDRYERTGKIDVAYLRTLGPDAAPALKDVVAVCVPADGIAGFNLARAAARRTSTAHRTGASGRCDPPRPNQ
jgi:hypothetical protein